MAFPVGVTTATCTAGPDLSFFGADVAVSAEVQVVLSGSATHIVWAATGQPFDSFIEELSADAGQPLSFQLPHVDQAGFKASNGDDITMWAYKVTIIARRGAEVKTRTKNFQLLTGQTLVDLDLIPDGSITVPLSAPSPAVDSVMGLTGLVTKTELLDGLALRRQKLGELFRPAETALMPATKATVTSVTSFPAWYTVGSTQYRWDDEEAHGLNGPPTEAVPGDPTQGCKLFTAGGDTNKIIDDEFEVATDKFLIWGAATSVRIWIDDQPVSQDAIIPDLIGGVYAIMVVDFGTYRKARVRVAGFAILVDVTVNGTAGVCKAITPAQTIGVLADSYWEPFPFVAGHSDCAAIFLRTLTGMRVWDMAQGSTGNVADSAVPGRGRYGSAARLAIIETAPIDRLLIYGSINDEPYAKAVIKAAALQLYADVKDIRPEIPVYTFGAEPLAGYRGANGLAVNEAIQEASAESDNVEGFIDGFTVPWLTGTGNDAAPVGDGTQDEFIGPDTFHPSAIGNDWLTSLLVNELAHLPADVRTA